MNYSLYFLQNIGNQCQAMYYYQLASNEQLSLEEEFMLFRTSEFISKALVKTNKPSDFTFSEADETSLFITCKPIMK